MNTTLNLGKVHLIGAGPGHADLITVRGLRLLRTADIVIHDRLIPVELLTEASPRAIVIDVGKTPGRPSPKQPDINALLVEYARAGKTVVRLKGGDPLIFGRGGEELEACRDAGVECEIIPGVTSPLAAAAVAGIPVTHRGEARSLAIITGRVGGPNGLPEYDYDALARIDTLVLLMGRASLDAITRNLIAAGRDPATPAACVASATLPEQHIAAGRLDNIAAIADRENIASPLVTVIGPTAGWAARNLNPSAWPAARGALFNRRIAITQADTTSSELRRLIESEDGQIVRCPVSQIRAAEDNTAINNAIRDIHRYNWIAFSSVHGARWFGRRLTALKRDARALAGVKIAAIGRGTARALRKLGIHADLIPEQPTVESLAAALGSATDNNRQADAEQPRLLYPRGDLASTTFAVKLRLAGFRVDDPIIYVNEAVAPPTAVAKLVRTGVDAILLCSPSAARRFGELDLKETSAPIGCIGPSTASAAASAGVNVSFTAEPAGSAHLIRALLDHLAADKANRQVG